MKPLLDRVPVTWSRGLQVLCGVLLVVAYADLRRLGAQFDFAVEVEYWLFQPSEDAPVAILLLAGWLLYRRRHRIAGLDSGQGSLAWAAAPLVVGTFAYVWAMHTGVQSLQVISLVLNASGLVLLYWGPPGLRALWLPIVFILFAVGIPSPLMNFVVWKLQIWTAQYAGWLLYLVGVPALVSGDQILRATQAFQVIEGCSGLRSVETLSMLTILLIDLFGRRGWHAVILFALAPVVAFALNGLRVLTLILNPHSEIVAIHNLQGIVILLVGLVLIYLVDGLLERFDLFRADSAPPKARNDFERTPVRHRIVAVLAVLACTLTLVWVAVPKWPAVTRGRLDLRGAIDTALTGWESEAVEPDYSYQGRVLFGQQSDRLYMVDGHDVFVFVALADLNYGVGTSLSPITERPGSGWRLVERRPLELESGRTDANELVFEKGKRRLLVHQWTSGADGLLNETLRMLLGLDRSMVRREWAPLIVRLATPLESRAAAARETAGQRLARVRTRLAPAIVQLTGN